MCNTQNTIDSAVDAREAYKDCKKIDDVLAQLLRERPPGAQTAHYWRIVIRTTGTALSLIRLTLPNDPA